MSETWWLRLARAQRYVEELQNALAQFAARAAFRARRLDQGDGQGVCRFALEITGQPEPMSTLLASETVRAVRASLDDVLRAMRPWRHRDGPGFPLLLEDPWEADGCGRLLAARIEARRQFDAAAAGLTCQATAAVRDLQPYRGLKSGAAPGLHPLLLLARLEGAERRRQFRLACIGLTNVETAVLVRGERAQFRRVRPTSALMPGLVPDGAEIIRLACTAVPVLEDSDVEAVVHVTPAVVMAVDAADGGWVGLNQLTELVRRVQSEVVAVLDRYVGVTQRFPPRGPVPRPGTGV